MKRQPLLVTTLGGSSVLIRAWERAIGRHVRSGLWLEWDWHDWTR
jgi:hypothetical protein